MISGFAGLSWCWCARAPPVCATAGTRSPGGSTRGSRPTAACTTKIIRPKRRSGRRRRGGVSLSRCRRGTPPRPGTRGLGERRRVGRAPHHEQRVARKLDDVALVGVHDLDGAPQEVRHDRREQLRTVRPLRQPLRQGLGRPKAARARVQAARGRAATERGRKERARVQTEAAAEAVTQPGVLRIVTWNVWFSPRQAEERMAALFSQALATAPDVLCLQEGLPELAITGFYSIALLKLGMLNKDKTPEQCRVVLLV